jgi:hypothetical protein
MRSGDPFCLILLLGLLLLVVFFSSEAMVMGTRHVCSCFVSSGRWGPKCKSGAGRDEGTMQEKEIGGQRQQQEQGES